MALEDPIEFDPDARYILELNESQAIASGYCPKAVKARLIEMLDWRRQDELRAQRPYKVERKRKAMR